MVSGFSDRIPGGAMQAMAFEAISRENPDVKLGRLRKKLPVCGAAPPVIQSLRGLGYKLRSQIKVLSELGAPDKTKTRTGSFYSVVDFTH